MLVPCVCRAPSDDLSTTDPTEPKGVRVTHPPFPGTGKNLAPLLRSTVKTLARGYTLSCTPFYRRG